MNKVEQEEVVVVVEEYSPSIYMIKLNRPKALNALTRDMMKQLSQAFNELAKRDGVRVVILTGEGKAFSSGVDLTAAMSVFQGDQSEMDRIDPVKAMEAFPHPIIGAINGYAITGGFELALACDILIASQSAVFQDTHSKFAIFPTWGLSQKLSRMIGVHRAKQVSLSAMRVDANLADKWGIVNQVVPNDQLMQSCIQIAQSIVANDKSLVVQYKRVIDDGYAMNYGEARRIEKQRGQHYYQHMSKSQFDQMNKFINSRSSASTTTKKPLHPSKL